MRISLRHSTVFRYDRPVVLEPHIFRLRPREDASQRLIHHRIDISPEPQGRAQWVDQDGNVAEQSWFAGAVTELAVRNWFELETLRTNPFDFLLPLPAELELPLRYRDADRAALAPFLLPAPAGVTGFAAALREQAGGQTMPFLSLLLRDLFERTEHVFRPEGPPNPAGKTLAERRGSCRDLAALFCAACRACGIAAQFVSGYETASAFRDDSHMHAWSEVYVPGGGWRGYDPSRGVAVSTAHVAVAASADPALAAPITGTYRGAAKATMEIAISMQASE